jgi:hypothetical protein
VPYRFEEMNLKKGLFLGNGRAAVALSSIEKMKKKKGVFPGEEEGRCGSK